MRIQRFIVTWAFSTNEKVWKLADSTRALSSQRRRTVKHASLQEDASFYFNLKSFSCQVQQKVFLTLVSDVFRNLSFDLPVLSLLFACLNKLDRSPSITLRYSFVKCQVVFVFICLKISTFLFADTYSLQSKEKYMALKSTTSPKSLHDKQIKQTLTWGFDETAPWKYCICVVCSWYYIAIYSFQFFVSKPISYLCKRYANSFVYTIFTILVIFLFSKDLITYLNVLQWLNIVYVDLLKLHFIQDLHVYELYFPNKFAD